MLDRFTSRARRVIVLATEEARSRGHETIGPEHVLLGILRDGDGMAVKVLERLGRAANALNAAAEGLLSETPASPTGARPAFSPELRDVLQAALASRFQASHLIGTENLLLGILAYRGAASAALHAAGVSEHEVRRALSIFYDSVAVPITAENIRLIATSRWRIDV